MILNNLSEGFATLLAVFLGAGLTIITTFITEKQAQKNRIKEQVREHQIDSVKSIVHSMQKLDFITNKIYQFLQSELIGINEIQSQAQRINKKNNFKQQLTEEKIKFLEQKNIILQELWELRFLKYENNGISLIEHYVEEVNSIELEIDCYQHSDFEECDIDKFFNFTKELHFSFIKYVEGAKNGLSK